MCCNYSLNYFKFDDGKIYFLCSFTNDNINRINLFCCDIWIVLRKSGVTKEEIYVLVIFTYGE
jgi:hypothetical protein